MAPLAFARIGALRYFDAAGAFSRDLTVIMGGPLPKPLRAVRHAGTDPGAERSAPTTGMLSLFRSPTETWVLCRSAGPFEAIERFAAPRADLCLIEQTGGIWCGRLFGPRAGDVLPRLGSTHSLPSPGQALTGRLADVTVTTVCIDPGEYLLLTDRVYADHLSSWMRATIDDL
jgi:hypothetical protein